jgi:hypothetical protein
MSTLYLRLNSNRHEPNAALADARFARQRGYSEISSISSTAQGSIWGFDSRCVSLRDSTQPDREDEGWICLTGLLYLLVLLAGAFTGYLAGLFSLIRTANADGKIKSLGAVEVTDLRLVDSDGKVVGRIYVNGSIGPTIALGTNRQTINGAASQ